MCALYCVRIPAPPLAGSALGSALTLGKPASSHLCRKDSGVSALWAVVRPGGGAARSTPCSVSAWCAAALATNLRSQNEAASSVVLKRRNQPIRSRGARGALSMGDSTQLRFPGCEAESRLSSLPFSLGAGTERSSVTGPGPHQAGEAGAGSSASGPAPFPLPQMGPGLSG